MKSLLFSALICTASFTSCAQDYKVVKAPHRKIASAKVAGTIEQSHPVQVSKNHGVGRTVGSVAGAFGGANIGSGAGRYIGIFAGRLIGSLAGNKAETSYRRKDAQEVTVKLNEQIYKFINVGEHQYSPGDKVWATTNTYGEPLSLTPR